MPRLRLATPSGGSAASQTRDPKGVSIPLITGAKNLLFFPQKASPLHAASLLSSALFSALSLQPGEYRVLVNY